MKDSIERLESNLDVEQQIHSQVMDAIRGPISGLISKATTNVATLLTKTFDNKLRDLTELLLRRCTRPQPAIIDTTKGGTKVVAANPTCSEFLTMAAAAKIRLPQNGSFLCALTTTLCSNVEAGRRGVNVASHRICSDACFFARPNIEGWGG